MGEDAEAPRGLALLYDTSAVIELLARRRVKRLHGAVSALTVVEYPPAARAAALVLYPSRRDYLTAARWQALLRRRGNPLPAVDLVIAAQAYNNGLVLVTLDRHFRVIRGLEPSLKIVEEV